MIMIMIIIKENNKLIESIAILIEKMGMLQYFNNITKESY